MRTAPQPNSFIVPGAVCLARLYGSPSDVPPDALLVLNLGPGPVPRERRRSWGTRRSVEVLNCCMCRVEVYYYCPLPPAGSNAGLSLPSLRQ
jgi:hypothetical protein